MSTDTESTSASTAELMEQILYQVKRVVVGQDHFLERVMVAVLAQGHLLVEGVPGLAKTLTVKTLAQTLRGTGHVNAGLGAVMTLQGLGAAASPALAGWIAQRFGFDAAFLSLGGIAVLALALCWFGAPAEPRAAHLQPKT